MTSDSVPSDFFGPTTISFGNRDQIQRALNKGVAAALAVATLTQQVPPIGGGQSVKRLMIVSEIAAIDLSLGRVFEGHCDAVDIVAQAGLSVRAGSYGVWTADPSGLAVSPSDVGSSLTGAKPYCSGAPFLNYALVSASSSGGDQLFEVEMNPAIKQVECSWPSVGMRDSASFTLEFHGCPTLRRIGVPGFYVQRPGFWQGSLSVAACWFGGALGLARGVFGQVQASENHHHLAALGALGSEIKSMRWILEKAGHETDADPADSTRIAKERAYTVRYLVYRSASRVLELASEIGGTSGMAHDSAQSRRLADLPIYLRQFHPGPDSEALGRMVIERAAHA